MWGETILVLKKKDSDEPFRSIFMFWLIDEKDIAMKGNIETYSDEDELEEILQILLRKFIRGG